jgi:hypothetical protein
LSELDDILEDKEETENVSKDITVPQISLTKEINNGLLETDDNSKNNELGVLFNPKPEPQPVQQTAQQTAQQPVNGITPGSIILITSSVCILFASLIALGTFVGLKLYDKVKVNPADLEKVEKPVEPEVLPMSDSLQPITAKVKDISWEVPESLAYNDIMREYLQLAGKNIKLNLLNELLLTTEYAYSEKVVVDITVSKTGEIKNMMVSTSSGSKIIDKIITGTIKDTMKYLKIPTDELIDSETNLSLVISF